MNNNFNKWSKELSTNDINVNMNCQLSNGKSDMSYLYYINDISIYNKLPFIIVSLQTRDYYIILITQIWLNNSITNAMLLTNNYYTLYRQYRANY